MGEDGKDNSSLAVVPNSSGAMIMHPAYAPVNITTATHSHLHTHHHHEHIIIQTPCLPNPPLSTLLVNLSYQPIISETHTCPHTHHHTHTPCPAFLTHLPNPSQPTLSTHPINPPSIIHLVGDHRVSPLEHAHHVHRTTTIGVCRQWGPSFAAERRSAIRHHRDARRLVVRG